MAAFLTKYGAYLLKNATAVIKKTFATVYPEILLSYLTCINSPKWLYMK